MDTQSSCDIVKNETLLETIESDEGAGLKLVSDGNGVFESNMKGTVKGYGQVWYHPESVAIILSFANIRKKFKLSILTGPFDKEPTITVIKSNGRLMSFKDT